MRYWIIDLDVSKNFPFSDKLANVQTKIDAVSIYLCTTNIWTMRLYLQLLSYGCQSTAESQFHEVSFRMDLK